MVHRARRFLPIVRWKNGHCASSALDCRGLLDRARPDEILLSMQFVGPLAKVWLVVTCIRAVRPRASDTPLPSFYSENHSRAVATPTPSSRDRPAAIAAPDPESGSQDGHRNHRARNQALYFRRRKLVAETPPRRQPKCHSLRRSLPTHAQVRAGSPDIANRICARWPGAPETLEGNRRAEADLASNSQIESR